MNKVNLVEAVQILKKGGIVIFPTDTAWGIGCCIDNVEAVEKLFRLRKRPFNKAVPVLVASLSQAQDYLLPLSDIVRLLMKTYWPGPLTIVYPCQLTKVPSLVRGGGLNLGVRMPNHQLILSLIKKVGKPILGPSANFSQKPTPYSLADLDPALVKLVDGVLVGACYYKKVSTVIDCSQKPFKIVRQGAQKIDPNFLR